MGQGQEVHARRIIANCFQTGEWMLLQNCHLSLDYVVEVMDTVLDTETVNDSFRLWVTTEEHKNFPINFLQVRLIRNTAKERLRVCALRETVELNVCQWETADNTGSLFSGNFYELNFDSHGYVCLICIVSDFNKVHQ